MVGEVPSLLPSASPEVALASLADLLRLVAESGLELSADRLADLLMRARYEAQLAVIGRRMSADVDAGRLPAGVLAEFDRWTTEQRRRWGLAGFVAEDPR